MHQVAVNFGHCVQETASDEAQKYKEGKFIIEKARVMKVSW